MLRMLRTILKNKAMIKPEEITLSSIADIYSAVRNAAIEIDTLDDDCDDGIYGPTEAAEKLNQIFATIKQAFGE